MRGVAGVNYVERCFPYVLTACFINNLCRAAALEKRPFKFEPEFDDCDCLFETVFRNCKDIRTLMWP